MPILRAEKESLVTKLTEELNDSRVALIFAYTALNSKANLKLRDNAFEQGGKIKMISNNLLRLVLNNQKRELEIPERQLALAYGFQDEVVAAKILADFSKEVEGLEVLAGWIDGKFFAAGDVKTLASLPSKEVLHGQVVSRLGGLIQSLVYNLNFPLQQFAYVVQAINTKKEGE